MREVDASIIKRKNVIEPKRHKDANRSVQPGHTILCHENVCECVCVCVCWREREDRERERERQRGKEIDR